MAAAVAVAAVPVGLTLFDGDDSRRDVIVRAGDGGADRGARAAGRRTETWRDLSVSVPEVWGWDSGFGWCLGEQSVEDVVGVSRPVDAAPAIGCIPGVAHGAHFTTPGSDLVPESEEGVVEQPSGSGLPDGAWVGWRGTDQAAVVVVAEDRSTAQAVLDSATPVGEVDANGCATRLEMVAPSTPAKQMSVCRYDGEGWLEQSERLASAQAAEAAGALRSAPSATGAQACSPGLTGEVPTIVMDGAGVSAQVVLEGECAGTHDPGGRVRQISPAVLRWALSPGAPGATRAD